jgi:tRNA threonylcarbamoyladenosine biosynthesis protein TsaE
MRQVTWRTVSKTAGETEKLAERIGKALRGGETIELVSDLGGGKTTFVRGLMRGTGSKDVVASPTFTISKLYGAPKFHVHHFDFYRLQEPGIIAEELAEVAEDPMDVAVIEWADVVRHVLPAKRLHVAIAQTPDGARDIAFTAPESLVYLVEAMK